MVNIYKPFPKSITVFDDNIFMHVWLSKQFDKSKFLSPQIVRLVNAPLYFHVYTCIFDRTIPLRNSKHRLLSQYIKFNDLTV
jgi:hypothetical protein